MSNTPMRGDRRFRRPRKGAEPELPPFEPLLVKAPKEEPAPEPWEPRDQFTYHDTPDGLEAIKNWHRDLTNQHLERIESHHLAKERDSILESGSPQGVNHPVVERDSREVATPGGVGGGWRRFAGRKRKALDPPKDDADALQRVVEQCMRVPWAAERGRVRRMSAVLDSLGSFASILPRAAAWRARFRAMGLKPYNTGQDAGRARSRMVGTRGCVMARRELCRLQARGELAALAETWAARAHWRNRGKQGQQGEHPTRHGVPHGTVGGADRGNALL